MSTDYEKAVDALMKDVKDLRTDMKSILSAIHGKAKDRADSIRESLQEAGAERVDQVHDAACAVGRSCQHALDGYAEKIGQRPFLSVLTAVGVGVILAGLLRRRH